MASSESNRALNSSAFFGHRWHGRLAWQLAIAVIVLLSRPADAGTVFTIYGSGIGADLSTTSGVDPNWKIVALPGSATGLPPTPYNASVPRTVAEPWIGGSTTPQTGYTEDGTTYYWISPDDTALSITTGEYTYIVAQDFNVTTAGTYAFNFNATVDNELQFFVGGSLSDIGTEFPTIVGGTQIGLTLSGTGIFTSIHSFTGTATLAAGPNTAYAVVRDRGFHTGVLITESSYTESPAVPEIDPSGVAIVASIVSGLFGILERRRLLRRA